MNHRRIRVGEQLPLVGTRLGSLWTLRDGKVKRLPLADIFYEGSKVVLFAVPGPFTPGCTRVHLPSFQEQRAALARAGATDVVCVAVSDPFVMHAWAVQCAREHAPRDGEYAASPTGGVLLLADPHLELTRALGMELDARAAGLGWRSRRYLMVVESGRVSSLQVDESKLTDATCAPAALSKL